MILVAINVGVTHLTFLSLTLFGQTELLKALLAYSPRSLLLLKLKKNNL